LEGLPPPPLEELCNFLWMQIFYHAQMESKVRFALLVVFESIFPLVTFMMGSIHGMASLLLIILHQPSSGDINDGFVMVSLSLILLHQPSAGYINDGFVMVSSSLILLHQPSASMTHSLWLLNHCFHCINCQLVTSIMDSLSKRLDSVDKFGNEVCLKRWQ